MQTSSVSPVRNFASIVLVIVAVAITTYAGLLDSAAFQAGRWKGCIFIYIGIFYLFFRVRGGKTWLGPITIDTQSNPAIRFVADFVAGVSLLVGVYSVFRSF